MVNYDFDLVYYFYALCTVVFIYLYKNGFYKDYFKNFWRVVKESKKIIFITLAIILITIAFFDLDIILFVKSVRDNPVVRVIAGLGNSLGDGDYLFSTLISILFIAIILKRKKLEQLMYMSLGSTLALSILNLFFKIFFHRQRPLVDYNPHLLFAYGTSIFEGNFFRSAYGSMPSGHTTSITAAMLIFAFYCKNKYYKALFFFLPFVTALGRLYNQKHWFSDILLGYLIAYLFTKAFYEFNKHRVENKESDN